MARLEPIIGAARYARLARAADWLRQVLAGRAVWCVSSAAAGGGVAEMLQTLVGYAQGLDVPVGWLVISGDVGFFAITKRLHNQMHGNPAGGPGKTLPGRGGTTHEPLSDALGPELRGRPAPFDKRGEKGECC